MVGYIVAEAADLVKAYSMTELAIDEQAQSYGPIVIALSEDDDIYTLVDSTGIGCNAESSDIRPL